MKCKCVYGKDGKKIGECFYCVKKELMKSWKYRFWHYIMTPFRWIERLKIRKELSKK